MFMQHLYLHNTLPYLQIAPHSHGYMAACSAVIDYYLF